MKRILTLLFLAVVLYTGPGKSSEVFGQVNFLKVGGKIEAEANKEYPLKDSDGLWFIMAKKFNGPEARKQANRLVYELRKRYKLPAYIFQYNEDEDDLKRLTQEIGDSRGYRYLTPPPKEFAVLVGSFPASDDPALQKTLLTIKRSQPDSLKNDSESKMAVRQFEVLAQKNKEYAGYGPLGNALAVPNPLIPKDYFAQKGVVDSFVAKINSDSPYSLLKNPRLYTLRVATFSGKSVMENDKKNWDKTESKFQDAGIKAAALCAALRKKKIEAWEFHDRDCSFVTIGSFDSYGTPNPDGTTELNPDIHRLMEKYRGKIMGSDGSYQSHCAQVEIKGKGKDRIKVEIPFDLQPVIIMVPQLPENVKRIVAARSERAKEKERNNEIHLKESLTAENEYFSAKYGQSDRGSLSEGEVISEEEAAYMLAQEQGTTAPAGFQASRMTGESARTATAEKKTVKVNDNRVKTPSPTETAVLARGAGRTKATAATAPQPTRSYRSQAIKTATPGNAAPTY